MTDINLIKKYLPEDLWTVAWKFDIPEDFLIDMPNLINMILTSKSIDTDDEKQNWFNLLVIMNEDQVNKLVEILEKEKQKIAEIEEKYEKKKKDIKKKYILKWQEMWYVKKISQIHDDEQKNKSQEELEAEKLLEMI